ncbi:MAG: hypothetical protein IJ874_05750 [Ruminococcus sp.]|nr:hypothetical protein [Ruminococcus sp.]
MEENKMTREYITEHGRVTAADAAEIAQRFYTGGCSVYAVYTDRFCCGKEPVDDFSHLLELRIFTEKSELKMSRFDISGEFIWRYIDDDRFRERLDAEKAQDEFLSDFGSRTFREIQYLDIDRPATDRDPDGLYHTTGGGTFSLPVRNAERIELLSYLDYDDNGILSVNDMRIVRIIEREAD